MRSISTLSRSSSGASPTCFRFCSRSWSVSSSSTMRARCDCTSCESVLRCRSSTITTRLLRCSQCRGTGAACLCNRSQCRAIHELRASLSVADSPEISLEDAFRADLLHAVSHGEHDLRDLDLGRGEEAAHVVVAHAGARYQAHVARLGMQPRVVAGIALA